LAGHLQGRIDGAPAPRLCVVSDFVAGARVWMSRGRVVVFN